MVKRINKLPFELLSPQSTGVIGPYTQPIAHVTLGEEIEVETWDCCGGAIKPGQTRQQAADRGIKLPTNPVTGPIFVEGAEPGDVLAIDILEIKMPEHGFTSLGQGISPIGLQVEQAKTRFSEIIGNRIHYVTDRGRNIVMEADPFIGTIGISPLSEAVSTITPGPHGGNMDCPDIRTGARLFLKVNQKGALLSLGDVHAIQGDGEICGTAVEIDAVVRLKLNIIKGSNIMWPHIETLEEIMTVCSARPLEDAARIAYRELINWMAADYGWNRDDAQILLSLVAKARIAQIVDPQYTVVAKLDKKYLKE
jgi:amidase